MKRVLVVVVLSTVSALAPVTSVQSALTPADKCALSKQKAMAKKAAAEFACYAKAIAKATSADPICLTAAAAKFTDAFAKAEAKGGCAVVGDTGSQEGAVDRFVATAAGTEVTSGCSGGVGSSCGSCGTGFCDADCVGTTPGQVVCVGLLSSSPCSSDADCPSGGLCVEGAHGCGPGSGMCVMPCP